MALTKQEIQEAVKDDIGIEYGIGNLLTTVYRMLDDLHDEYGDNPRPMTNEELTHAVGLLCFAVEHIATLLGVKMPETDAYGNPARRQFKQKKD